VEGLNTTAKEKVLTNEQKEAATWVSSEGKSY